MVWLAPSTLKLESRKSSSGGACGVGVGVGVGVRRTGFGRGRGGTFTCGRAVSVTAYPGVAGLTEGAGAVVGLGGAWVRVVSEGPAVTT